MAVVALADNCWDKRHRLLAKALSRPIVSKIRLLHDSGLLFHRTTPLYPYVIYIRLPWLGVTIITLALILLLPFHKAVFDLSVAVSAFLSVTRHRTMLHLVGLSCSPLAT